MRGFNRFLAVLCAIAFVIAAPLGVAAFNIDRTVLSAPAWTSAAEVNDLYGAFANVAVEQLHQGPDAPLAALPEDEVREIAVALLPVGVVRPLVDEGITELVAFGRAERNDVSISMVDFKREAQTRFPETLLRIVADKPVCASPADYHTYTCRPRPADQAQYEQMLRDGAARAWGDLPDTYEFVSEESLDTEAREVRAGFAFAIKYAPWVALGLLALIAFFAVRGVRGLLLWVGAPLFLAGLLTFAVWALSGYIEQEIVRGLQEDTTAAAANAALAPVFETVISLFVATLLIWAGIVAITGFGMTVGGSFMPRTEAGEDA